MKEKGTSGSHFKKNKKNKNKKNKNLVSYMDKETRERGPNVFVFIFIFFSSLASFFDIRKSDRRNSSRQ